MKVAIVVTCMDSSPCQFLKRVLRVTKRHTAYTWKNLETSNLNNHADLSIRAH
jgi:hypothetical protein